MSLFFRSKKVVFLFMFAISFIFTGGARAEKETIQRYLDNLSSNSIEVRILAAQNIVSANINDEALLDKIEKQLRQNYTREGLNLNEIDLYSWYCKDLSSSGLKKYQETLQEVADKSPYTKIKYYAKQGLDSLSTYATYNKDLSLTPKSNLPILDKQNAKLMAMLKSDNLQLKSDAAKIVSRSMSVDQKVYGEIKYQLLAGYHSADGNKKLIDLMSWYCKALASSGQDTYKPAVDTVLHNTNNSKLKRYAGISLDSFAKHADKHKKISDYIEGGLDEYSSSLVYNLKSDNLFHKFKACKKLLVREHVEPDILEAVDRELLFGLTQQVTEDEDDSYGSYEVIVQSKQWKMSASGSMLVSYSAMYDEVMSLMCKVLSNSGDIKYKKTLERVIHSTNSYKVKSYAKKAYNKLQL